MTIEDKTSNEGESPLKSMPLSREEFIRFVELDLWSRFSGRLWAIIGVVLTCIGLAGVFGVPYYINNELDKKLKTVTQEFNQKSTQALQYSKVLVLATLNYQHELSLFRNEVSMYLSAIQHHVNVTELEEVTKKKLVNIRIALNALMTTDEHQWLVVGNMVMKRNLRYLSEENDFKIAGAKISKEGSFGLHPIQRGKINDIIRHVKFRVVGLVSYSNSIERLKIKLSELGYQTRFEQAGEKYEIKSIYENQFMKLYDEEIQIVPPKVLNETDEDLLKSKLDAYKIKAPI